MKTGIGFRRSTPVMLLWLTQYFPHLFSSPDLSAETLSSRPSSEIFLTARIAGSSITAFLLTLLIGPWVIRWLRTRFRERISSGSETLNQLHADKQDTPTMGGLFIMSAVLLATLVWGDLTSLLVIAGITAVLLLTAIGAFDDWTKQTTKQHGISVRRKFALQLAAAAVVAFLVHQGVAKKSGDVVLPWPLHSSSFAAAIVFLLWSALVVVSTSNAVNLTDGLDGLASGCVIPAASAMALVTYMSGHKVIADYLQVPYVAGCGEISVMLGALVGAMLGFLWFNCHPADVFMGDAGSLPVGGLLAVGALAGRQELLLTVVGGVLVAETLSVIMQVIGFRLTGRRILRCSPLHNHFVFRGDNETKIVTRFWIAAILLSITGLALLKAG